MLPLIDLKGITFLKITVKRAFCNMSTEMFVPEKSELMISSEKNLPLIKNFLCIDAKWNFIFTGILSIHQDFNALNGSKITGIIDHFLSHIFIAYNVVNESRSFGWEISRLN